MLFFILRDILYAVDMSELKGLGIMMYLFTSRTSGLKLSLNRIIPELSIDEPKSKYRYPFSTPCLILWYVNRF